METTRLDRSDLKAAARVFARAFAEYPMMTFYWPDPVRRARYLEWYVGCAVEYGLRYGEVYAAPGVSGISIWLPPGQTHLTNWRYVQAGFLPALWRMGVRHYFSQAVKNDDHVVKVHEEIVPGPHWYLWAIAVDPDQQGKGIGTALLRPGLHSADMQQLPCYLETHDDRNVPFYTARGFELVRSEQVPGFDLRFWSFLRQPQKT